MANFQQWACRREERIFFLLFHVLIFFFSFFFQNYYKGLHECKFKNTQECIAKMLTSKPMYKENKCIWGCITWCRFCTVIKPCVCVCVLPRLKAGSKTSFGAFRSFLPPKFRNSELHNLQFVSGVLSPSLMLLLLMVVVVPIVAEVQEQKKKKKQQQFKNTRN